MESEKKKKMMVAIDESDCSHYALQWALSHLHDTISTSNSPLLIFSAIALPNLSTLYASTYAAACTFFNLSLYSILINLLYLSSPILIQSLISIEAPELITSLQENQKKIVAALLDKAKDLCAKHGVCMYSIISTSTVYGNSDVDLVKQIEAETIIEIGDPKEMICEAVEKHKVELLILGSHGRGAIKRLVLVFIYHFSMQIMMLLDVN